LGGRKRGRHWRETEVERLDQAKRRFPSSRGSASGSKRGGKKIFLASCGGVSNNWNNGKVERNPLAQKKRTPNHKSERTRIRRIRQGVSPIQCGVEGKLIE